MAWWPSASFIWIKPPGDCHSSPVRAATISSVEGFLPPLPAIAFSMARSEEHTSELQSHVNLVCRLLLEKKKKNKKKNNTKQQNKQSQRLKRTSSCPDLTSLAVHAIYVQLSYSHL